MQRDMRRCREVGRLSSSEYDPREIPGPNPNPHPHLTLTLTLTLKLTLTLTLTLTPSLTPSLIGTILERETVGKYALGKGAPVRDCRALTPVRNQVRGRDRVRVRVTVRVSALTPVRNQVADGDLKNILMGETPCTGRPTLHLELDPGQPYVLAASTQPHEPYANPITLALTLTLTLTLGEHQAGRAARPISPLHLLYISPVLPRRAPSWPSSSAASGSRSRQIQSSRSQPYRRRDSGYSP